MTKIKKPAKKKTGLDKGSTSHVLCDLAPPRALPKRPPPPPAKETAATYGFKLPAYVGDKEHAIEEFDRIVCELKGQIRQVDLSLIIHYVILHHDCIIIQEAADASEFALEGAKGGSYTNPLQNLLVSKQNSLAQLRRDLYFTPRSRAEKTKPSGKAKGILEALNAGQTAEEAAGMAD